MWLQLASGRTPRRCPTSSAASRRKIDDLFDGITAMSRRAATSARLVIGPFRGASDADIFAEDLEIVGVDAFSWTNSETDRIVPLGTE